MIWHWLLHYTGSDNVSGPWYGFWSGFGSDLGEVTIVAALYGVYKKHNCGTRWCPRIAKHEWTDEAGLVHHLCRKHHPGHSGKPITAAEINRQAGT